MCYMFIYFKIREIKLYILSNGIIRKLKLYLIVSFIHNFKRHTKPRKERIIVSSSSFSFFHSSIWDTALVHFKNKNPLNYL